MTVSRRFHWHSPENQGPSQITDHIPVSVDGPRRRKIYDLPRFTHTSKHGGKQARSRKQARIHASTSQLLSRQENTQAVRQALLYSCTYARPRPAPQTNVQTRHASNHESIQAPQRAQAPSQHADSPSTPAASPHWNAQSHTHIYIHTRDRLIDQRVRVVVGTNMAVAGTEFRAL